MCELKHGMAVERHGNSMGAAWSRHAMCEYAFFVPKFRNTLEKHTHHDVSLCYSNIIIIVIIITAAAAVIRHMI